jgi:hypothetical protein
MRSASVVTEPGRKLPPSPRIVVVIDAPYYCQFLPIALLWIRCPYNTIDDISISMKG